VNRVNRTAQCRNCEEVLFKIKPSIGYVIYNCVNCNDEVARVSYGKYETVMPACEECGGDIFKVRIKVDEQDNSHQYWEPECVKCKGSPKLVYVDNDGKLIDEGVRQSLMAKERLEELEEEVNTQKEIIEQLEDKIDDLHSEIEEKDNLINDLEYELDTSKRHASKLEKNISDLE